MSPVVSPVMSWDSTLESTRSAVVWLLEASSVPVLTYFFVINTSYLVVIALAALEFRSQARRRDSAVAALGGPLTPGVSLLVPAYNEEAGIVTSVKALLSLRYPRHEVVVVDDGSADATMARLVEAFDLVEIPRAIPQDVPVHAAVRSVHVPRDGHTRLIVVSKENSGRSEAINLGINASTEPLVAMIDADSILEPDALLRVTQPFTDDPTRMVATGGTIRAVNGSRVVSGRVVRVELPRRWLPRIQVVEYFRAFLLGRTGWSRFGGLILISGAFGLFRRDVLVEVGGLDHTSIGEDFELVMRIHKHMRDEHRDYRVQFVPEPVSWTEVPSTFGVLRSQRRRWHRGAVGDALDLPRHAAATEVRQGRHGRAALLLAVRADRAAARGLRHHHRADRAGPGRHQPALRDPVPAARLWLRHLRDPVRARRRGVGLPPARPLA
jgi:cellulose synthase/poly-beta-1,6-N-acetylglucosamine synthase-like glycosyltransferase